MQIPHYFKDAELRCRCCQGLIIQWQSLQRLYHMRILCGFPIYIQSAYRCTKHNEAIGGVHNSSHTRGYAYDIYTHDPNFRYHLVKAAFTAGFTRIKIYKNHIHVDDDPSATIQCDGLLLTED